jgi:hypothetical protein
MLGMRILLGSQSVDSRECLNRLLSYFLPHVLLNLLLFLQSVPIGQNEVSLWLFDPFEFSLYDRIRNVSLAAGPLHALHVEGVDHALSVFRHELFLNWLLLCFLLHLAHLLQKASIVDIVEQQHRISPLHLAFHVLLRLTITNGSAPQHSRLQAARVHEKALYG